MPNMIRAAKMGPPVMRQKFNRADAGEAAVVFTVSVAVLLPPDARLMLAGFKLHVGRPCAPAGEAIREQDRFSVPE